MKNTQNRIRNDIYEHVKRNMSAHIAKRICRVMDGFNSIEAFLNADKAGLQFAFRRAYPNIKRDLGAVFYRALDMVRVFCDGREEKPAKELDLVAPPPPLVFSLPELKAVTSFMELCGLKSIDIPKFKAFLACCNVTLPE